MTHLRRICQLIEDLQKLGIITSNEKIQFSFLNGQHRLTITNDVDSNVSVANRFLTIQASFLDEFVESKKEPGTVQAKLTNYREFELVLKSISFDSTSNSAKEGT